MKKVFWSLAMVLALSSCNEKESSTYNSSQFESRFEVAEEAYFEYKVVYDKTTRVMYAVSDGTYNRGNFTMLVNADGKPLLYEK